MKNILISLLIILCACKVSHVAPDRAVGKLGPNPYFEVDEKPLASPSELQSYSEADLASIEMLYGKKAVAVFGDKAKDGAVLLQTKHFARIKYQALFSSASLEYARIIGGDKYTEEDIQYILNERILKNNFEGNLAAIKKKDLKRIVVINQTELLNKYGVSDKKIGVVLKTKEHNAK